MNLHANKKTFPARFETKSEKLIRINIQIEYVMETVRFCFSNGDWDGIRKNLSYIKQLELQKDN